MIQYIDSDSVSSESFVHQYQCESDIMLAQAVNRKLIELGYKLTEGNVYQGIYEKGNPTTRILLGALSKYFKFSVKIENSRIMLSSESSGISGGLVGVGQVKSEVKMLSNLLKSL